MTAARTGDEGHKLDVELGSKAYGLFDPQQARHMFAREFAAPQPPEAVELAPRTFQITPGMVNVGLFETDEGLLLVDCGAAGDGPGLLRAVRACSDKPLHTVVLTHAHVDHAFGLWAFLEAGERPTIIAHHNIAAHYRRYMKTAGYNAVINSQLPGANGKSWPGAPEDFFWPDITFTDTLELSIGGERFVCRHAKGETDDATWVWAPQRRVIAAGDLVVGYLPNAGNPRKVQRYAEEWADTAEEMAGLGAEAIITGHGDPVQGADTVREELQAITALLRHIIEHTLDGLNAGVLPDDIVESLKLPEHLANHPRLQPNHDRAEFVCRNLIRRYGGWWDGYPANLLPAPAAQRAREVAALAGGVSAVVARAYSVAEEDLRLACHLAEWAFLADRQDHAAQECYVELFARRQRTEASMMVKAALFTPGRWVEAARRASTQSAPAAEAP